MKREAREYAEGNQRVKAVEQRAGRDEGAVGDQVASLQREDFQLPAVLENVLESVVRQLFAAVKHQDILNHKARWQQLPNSCSRS